MGCLKIRITYDLVVFNTDFSWLVLLFHWSYSETTCL